MLLQVLSSVHSERQLVEQINDNLLFRCFVGLSIEDAVWNHCGSRQGLRHARLREGVPRHEGEPCVYPDDGRLQPHPVAQPCGFGGMKDEARAQNTRVPQCKDAMSSRMQVSTIDPAVGHRMSRPVVATVTHPPVQTSVFQRPA